MSEGVLNIQGKANYPRAIKEFEISQQIFMMTPKLLGAI